MRPKTVRPKTVRPKTVGPGVGDTEEAVYAFLQNPQSSELLLADPTGERPLAMADAVRKNLRLLH